MAAVVASVSRTTCEGAVLFSDTSVATVGDATFNRCTALVSVSFSNNRVATVGSS